MNITKTILAGLLAVSCVFATNMLQLDISDGVYDNNNENIVNTSNTFDLIALLNSNNPSGNYYISMALTPNDGLTKESELDLGYVIFDGNQIDVTKDMVYGVPPVELNLDFDAKDLAKHEVFPTFFKEFKFQFNSGNKANDYNTQDDPGSLTINNLTGSLFYKTFAVDVSMLDPKYGVHFDLYNEVVKSGDVDVSKFAPFSHDAEASVVAENVPEPAMFSLLGMGLLALSGMGLIRRRK